MNRHTYSIDDSFHTHDAGYYSYANYVKDAAVMAAAGLVGTLYGAATGVMMLASIATIAMIGALGLASGFAYSVGSSIMSGSPSKVAATVIGGAVGSAVVGAVGIGYVAALTALTAISIPFIMVQSAISGAKRAGDLPNAGLLDRIFGNYTAMSEASNQFHKEVQAKFNNKSGSNEIEI